MKEYTVKVYKDRTEWYLNGKRHREDGPAIEYADGSKSWYLNDKKYTEAEFLAKTTVQEMTMKELCKELGRTIKIKK